MSLDIESLELVELADLHALISDNQDMKFRKYDQVINMANFNPVSNLLTVGFLNLLTMFEISPNSSKLTWSLPRASGKDGSKSYPPLALCMATCPSS